MKKTRCSIGRYIFLLFTRNSSILSVFFFSRTTTAKSAGHIRSGEEPSFVTTLKTSTLASPIYTYGRHWNNNRNQTLRPARFLQNGTSYKLAPSASLTCVQVNGKHTVANNLNGNRADKKESTLEEGIPLACFNSNDFEGYRPNLGSEKCHWQCLVGTCIVLPTPRQAYPTLSPCRRAAGNARHMKKMGMHNFVYTKNALHTFFAASRFSYRALQSSNRYPDQSGTGTVTKLLKRMH